MGVPLARLAINHYLCPSDVSLERFATLVAESGAGGVGLTLRALREIPLAALKRLVRERGLRISSLSSVGYFLYRESARAEAQARENEHLLGVAAELEAACLVAIPGGLHEFGGSIEGARARSEEALLALAERAGTYGVQLALEPMHPLLAFERNTINTLAQATALAGRHRHIHLALDVFHSWWDPDFAELPAGLLERIALVQLSNIAQPEGAVRPTRTPFLSQGILDLSPVIRRLAGFAGWFEFEIFATQLAGQAVETVIGTAARDFATLAGSPLSPQGRD